MATLQRQASFTPGETFVLQNLFGVTDESLLQPIPSKTRRRSTLGLWKAHARGVPPETLAQRGSLVLKEPTNLKDFVHQLEEHPEAEEDSTASDVEVRRDTHSDNSSWDEHLQQYDAWEVLDDEYAPELGFDLTLRGLTTRSLMLDDDEVTKPSFLILGTSAHDTRAQPHVLSPPLMSALLTHVPQEENMWLKYSLLRDGASLETLRHYTRGSRNTILAIETTDGQVFGSYTERSWRIHPTWFGEGAWVWKMVHNRNTPCHSLFDQAQLESQIQVYPNHLKQISTHNRIATGDEGGLAIALDEDLRRGTSSATEHAPALGSQVFEIANLEIWTLTPCLDVEAAQKLELSKYLKDETRKDSTRSSESASRFYERIGDDLDSEERRQRWQYANMMNGTGSVGFSSPHIGYS